MVSYDTAIFLLGSKVEDTAFLKALLPSILRDVGVNSWPAILSEGISIKVSILY